MTEPTRLELELADALGATQAVRAAAADARERVTAGAKQRPGAKQRRRLERLETELADLQDEVNALVVSDLANRTALTGRSRRLRDTSGERLPDDADGIDALQTLAGEAAYALAQWQVVRRLARADGDARARKLARRALPLAEGHLKVALKAVDRLAKREAAG